MRLSRGRWRLVALAPALAAVALGVGAYRPWEAHYRGRPASWWAAEARLWEPDLADSLVFGWRRHPPAEEAPGRAAPATEADMPLLQGDPGAVPVLRALLHDPAWNVRRLAVYGLWRVGPAARPAAPELLAVWGADQDEGVRFSARAALRRIDPDALAAYEAAHGAGGPGTGE